MRAGVKTCPNCAYVQPARAKNPRPRAPGCRDEDPLDRLTRCSRCVPEKPWQVLRSTCNTRYKEIGSDAGKVMMHGPDADVNSAFYDEARPRTIKAVGEVPQPEAFLEIMG